MAKINAKIPLYDRFEFESMDLLVLRLKEVSTRFMDRIPFSAYLVNQEGEKTYGLNYEELTGNFKRNQAKIVALSASVSTLSEKVVRVNVRFNNTPKAPKGQFIISTGSNAQNKAIQNILLGAWDEVAYLKAKNEEESEPKDETIPVDSPGQARSRPVLKYPEFTYSKPTITTTDYFYFDVNTAPDTIIMLLNRLSNTFLNKALFHMRLETTDGDYHLAMDRYELRFMYQYRRDKMLMLYMDAATLDGQWINLRLSFHPLAPGPNGEVDITSHQAEDIMQMIWKTIGREQPESTIPERLNERFHFRPQDFEMEQLAKVFNEISRSYLYRIPPVAFLSTLPGDSYTGLSFYQLVKVYQRHIGQIDVLSVGITKIMTGQTLSLMFQFYPNDEAPYGTLSMMWGDTRKHQAVKELIWDEMNLSEYKPGLPPVSLPEIGPATLKKPTCLVSMPWETFWSEALWDYLEKGIKKAGFTPTTAKSIYAHKIWEDTMTAITQSDVLIADLSYKHPDVLYKVGIAQAFGKKVIMYVFSLFCTPFRHIAPSVKGLAA
jgi:hypothetical protein